MLLYDDVSDRINLFLGGQSALETPVSGVEDGKWHLITGTYNGARMCNYLDGVMVGCQAASGNITDGGESITLGNTVQADNSTMNGLLDDLRIYNRALSATEVRQLYNAGR
jgi:hypothetical protein